MEPLPGPQSLPEVDSGLGPEDAGLTTIADGGYSDAQTPMAIDATLPPTSPPIAPPPVTDPHDVLVRTQAGQVSDEFLRAADCYYLSSEISEDVRNPWNSHHAIWSDPARWGAPVETLTVPINASSHIRARSWAQFPSIAADGTLDFTHRVGWWSNEPPHRNYKHTTLNLAVREGTSHPAYDQGVVDRMLEDIDYESGFTFWQGGTTNWLREARKKIAIWQVHGGSSPVAIYVNSIGYGTMGIAGFWSAAPGEARNRFSYTFPDQSHDGIHVMRFEFRFGLRGYVRLFHNGDLAYDSSTVRIEHDQYYQDFLNYSDYENEDVDQTLHMDRLYRVAK